MKAVVKRHPLSWYFVVAYAVSWSIAVPLALQAQGVIATRLAFALHDLTAFGPAVAALIIAWIVRDPVGNGRSVQRNPAGRSAVWWTIGFGSPLLLFVIAQLVARMAGQTAPTWTALGT